MSSKIQVVRKKGPKGFWNKEIRPYYQTKKGITQLILKTIKDHGLPGIPAAELPSLEECQKTGKWEAILCDFGESCASWYLEGKEKIYFVKLRWVDFPLTTMTGLDLVGVRFPSEDICCAETKARNSPNISSTISDLSNQLSLERLNGILNSPINVYGSKLWLIEELLKAKKITPDKVEEIFEKSKYLRFGFVFHPKRKKPASYKIAEKTLDEGPITFVDYEMEDLEFEIRSFVQVIVVPLAVK